ncbi:hypothetical protein [Amycolatopsis sp. CA-230715]|uniref:hypothetical protein n=1 Tax=Amycolatopsis sp. CA-230715 TaxID=2745196 RepID=UPI001C01C876|nr:hypothetical protein [Amycolatopsis sp. CA-230715]QWF81875.1 hypothetical protein HUW46_05308 [Amycolatopsis sp. CA-230715]
MRTYFEPEDAEAFEAAKDLLIRRCTAWADGQAVDRSALGAALDFRHHSVDGRLGYWTASLVEEFLLSHAPRTLAATAQDAAELPETLRLLVGYLHATGLADPTGDPLPQLDSAITKAATEFPAAMADERNFGLIKFWVMTAIRHGIDPDDDPAMGQFLDDARAGRVDYDEAVLDHIVREDAVPPERAVTQLPVSLPAEADLAEVAEHTQVVVQLRALADWVGDGRALTPNGNVKLKDARELVALLDTGDTLDPVIGDRVFRTRSSTDLSGLSRLIELAKEIRIVRVVKGRLVRVAKTAPLLHDGLALWTAGFDALPTPEFLLCEGALAAQHSQMLASILDDVLPDVLNTVYGMPEPMPVIRLAESVWRACAEVFVLDDLDPETARFWREGVAMDLRWLLGKLAEFGAVELTVGSPAPMYLADLNPSWELETGQPAPLPPDTVDRLRAELDGGPVELVALTPLTTRAVHARLIREGRHAPLVGELSNAEPAQLLGALAEHYSPETAEVEITEWLAAHGSQPHELLEGIRGCPFRTRAAAMLDVLARYVPDPLSFLQELRADEQLGPLAAQMLVQEGELTPDDLGHEQSMRAMTEQFIHLLEIGGADAVTGALANFPADEAHDMMAALLASGHPDQTGLGELRDLVHARRPDRASAHPLAGVSRRTPPPGRARKRRR